MFNSDEAGADRRTSFRRRPSHGQLNRTEAVPEKWASLLNALGFSLPTGRRRERERRPARPRRALLHAPGALCANAVPVRAPRVRARIPRKQARERRSPRGMHLGGSVNCARHESSRGRMNGSAFVAVHQPIRKPLGGTGSQHSHWPAGVTKPRNPMGCARSSRDALSDSHCPATNAGAVRSVPVSSPARARKLSSAVNGRHPSAHVGA